MIITNNELKILMKNIMKNLFMILLLKIKIVN